MSKRLVGKVAVVTGAASGIGEASARRFFEEGCKVVLGDIHVDAGQALALANAALWLASEESGYTTGHTLTVDAGITTGAMPGGPRFSKYSPMQREAGKSGL